MTLAEAARYIRVSAKTLRKMTRNGRIPGQKVGREWRFLRQALNEWLSKPPSTREETPSHRVTASSYKVPKSSEPLVQYKIPFSGFRDTAFRNNYQRALHRWVPWIAGFSASFVNGILERTDGAPHDKITVLDPFAGVGTTLVEALKNGHNAIGFEINPYAALAANVKINCHSYQVEILEERTEKLAQFVTKQTARESARPDSVHPEGFVSRVPFFSPTIERQVLFTLDFISRES